MSVVSFYRLKKESWRGINLLLDTDCVQGGPLDRKSDLLVNFREIRCYAHINVGKRTFKLPLSQ